MTVTEFNECLQHSTFTSLTEARDFIEWYKKSKYFTSWDENRKAYADLLVHSWQFVWKPIETATKEGYVWVRDSDDCPQKAHYSIDRWIRADTGDYLNFTPTEWCHLP